MPSHPRVAIGQRSGNTLAVTAPLTRSVARPTEVSALARVQPALPRVNQRNSRGLEQLDPDEYEEVEEDEDGRRRRKSSRRRGPPLGGGELNQEVEFPAAPIETGGAASIDTFSFLQEGIEAGSVTSLALTIPNPADADRLLLLVVQNRNNPSAPGDQPSVSGWTLVATEVDGTGIDDRISLFRRSMLAAEGDVTATITTASAQIYIIGHVYGVVGADLSDPIVQIVERNAGALSAGTVTLSFAAFADATNMAFTAGIGILDESDADHATVAGFDLISEGASPNPDGATSALAFGRESEIASAAWTHLAADVGNADLKVAMEVRRA